MMSLGVLLLIIVIIIASIALIRDSRRTARNRAAWRAKEEKLRAERQERKEKYDRMLDDFLAQYGQPTAKVDIAPEYRIDDLVLVFEQHEIVVMKGKGYKFSDILSCSIEDTARIRKGAVTYETKTDTSDVIGRSLVGDLLAGDKGAIIGGATAKSTTRAIQKDDDVTVHDYNVIVNVNSLTEPVITLHIGASSQMMNQITGLMNVIISRNQ